jgi:hypothetical protein
MQSEVNRSRGTGGVQRSSCPGPANYCPHYKMGAILGSNIQDILSSFVEGAEDGARLTLQKVRAGFTVQVVGAVRRGGDSTFRGSAGQTTSGDG